MDHIGKVFEANKLDGRPWAGYCSCGTQGDFPTKGEAVGYLQAHFQRIGFASKGWIEYPEPPKVVLPSQVPPAGKVVAPPAPPAPMWSPESNELDAKPRAAVPPPPAPKAA
jgi:hypothetical protein